MAEALAAVASGYPPVDVADRLAVINLIHSYGFFIDQYRMDDFFSLFTDNPVAEMWIAGELVMRDWPSLRGKIIERQEAFKREGTQRRHILSAPRFDMQNSSAIIGQSYVQLYTIKDGRLTMITTGYYDFTAVKQGTVWKIDRWIGHADAAVDSPEEVK